MELLHVFVGQSLLAEILAIAWVKRERGIVIFGGVLVSLLRIVQARLLRMVLRILGCQLDRSIEVGRGIAEIAHDFVQPGAFAIDLHVIRFDRQHLGVVGDCSVNVVLRRVDSGAQPNIEAVLRLDLYRLFYLLQRMRIVTFEIESLRALGGGGTWSGQLTKAARSSTIAISSFRSGACAVAILARFAA